METLFLKVQGEDGLVRDSSNKAILNINNVEYESYLARRALAKAQKQQFEQQAKDIEGLKNDINDIKQLLSLLINKQ